MKFDYDYFFLQFTFINTLKWYETLIYHNIKSFKVNENKMHLFYKVHIILVSPISYNMLYILFILSLCLIPPFYKIYILPSTLPSSIFMSPYNLSISSCMHKDHFCYQLVCIFPVPFLKLDAYAENILLSCFTAVMTYKIWRAVTKRLTWIFMTFVRWLDFHLFNE